MENNANQLQNQPMLCKKNCGFFGNPSCDGYCSKCYKDHVKKQNTGSAAGRVTPTTSLSTNNSEIKINHESSSSTVTSTTASPFSAAATSNAVTAAAGASSAAAATHSIPIPARQSSKLNEDFGMSVPVDMPAISNMNSSAAVASSLVGENMMACSVDEASTSPLACSMGAEKKKRTRCSVESCKRKVGLTGFDCRCGGLFCWEHRYSDKHECKFDYKELGQDQIRKNNPVVVGEKIQKI